MRLGIFVDVVYSRDGDGLSTNKPVMRFLLGLREHVDELVLLGRVKPGVDRQPYAIPPEVTFVDLPYYRSVWDVQEVLRAVPAGRRRAAETLPTLDAIWVLGPSPVSLSLALQARRLGTRLVLGVRQDYPAYIRARLPGSLWLPALLAANALEASYRLLARRVPTVVVGADLARLYRRGRAPVYELTILPVTSRDLDAGPRRAPRTYGRLELLWVGRLDREKGPETAFAALRLLDGRGVRDWRLTLAGDGPLEEELRDDSASFGERVRFLGHVPHGPLLFELFRSCDLFVHVSLTEGLPQAVLEAQAFGAPVIATDVGGVSAALGGGRTGVLIPPADPKALADAIESLAADPERAAALAARGRAAAERRTMDRELPRLVRFLAGSVPVRREPGRGALERDETP